VYLLDTDSNYLVVLSALLAILMVLDTNQLMDEKTCSQMSNCNDRIPFPGVTAVGVHVEKPFVGFMKDRIV
jgi:hypothetical protein